MRALVLMVSFGVGVGVGVGGCALSHERISTSCGPPCDAGPPMRVDAWVERTDGGVDPVDARVDPPDTDPRDTGNSPPLTRSGWVFVEDYVGSAPELGFSAYFSGSSIDDVRRGLWTPDCTIVGAVGACRAVRCPHVAHAGDLAGTITVAVTGGPVMSTTAPMPSSAAYGGAMLDAYVANAAGTGTGRTVTIRASGDVVPAFETTLVAPPFLVTTLPTNVSRSHDLTVRWDPIAASEVWIALLPQDLASTQPWILCSTPAASTSLTVDHTLLAARMLGESLFVEALAFQTANVAAPPYAIDVFVGSVGVGTAVIGP